MRYGIYPAYQLDGMTFCAECAYKSTAIGFLLALGRLPKDMEDAIASMVLVQIEAQKEGEIVAPAGVPNPTGTCEASCKRDLEEYAKEVAA